MAESLKDKTQVQAMIDEIRTSLISYVEKLKNNTFTQQDLQSLKEKTTVYFQKKEDYEVSLSHISDASK
jgi:cell shape-determining protein MreC